MITEVTDEDVVVDGNHMLAGQTLLFTVEVVSVREATAEEIAHGHLHQEGEGCCGGHHHHDDEEDGCCGGGHGGCGCGGHHHH